MAEFVQTQITRQQWIVSYDNVGPIKDLYRERRRTIYSIGYSARSTRRGSEVMFFCDRMNVPALVGPVVATEESVRAATAHTARDVPNISQEAQKPTLRGMDV